MSDRVGQQVGTYRLLKLLGQGGFAEVYLGEHILLHSQVAIKLLHTQLLPKVMERFLEEARTIARLIHPHIIRLLHFDIEPSNGTLYLVMDYAPHGSLRERHPMGTRVPLPTVVNYVTQVASALQYAHDQRVIHRDIKPENMLLSERDEILLSDFGLATVAHQSASMNTQGDAGTIYYMAPEQIRGKPRPASDQYSLAITVYEWLCGMHPFTGEISIEIAMQHISDPPSPLRSHNPTLPSAVEFVVLKALAKDPQQRYESVLNFAQALQQASTITPSASKPQPNIVTPPSQPLPQPIIYMPPATPKIYPPTESSIQLPPTVKASQQNIPKTDPQQSPISTNPQRAQRPYVPYPPPQSSSLERRQRGAPRISRRTAIIAGSSLLGGGVLWFTISRLISIPSGKLLFTYTGHKRSMNTAMWSSDGKKIASGSDDKTVQVWNVDGSVQPFTYKGHSAIVASVAWSPDGKQIASGSFDNTVQVWNADGSGKPFTYTGHSNWVTSVAWSPDGKQIASGSFDNIVQVWNADGSGKPFTYTGHSDVVNSVAWSLDGKRIASGSVDQTVQVWNVDGSGTPFVYRGHTNNVDSVAWSPDGRQIASSSRDETVQIWSAG